MGEIKAESTSAGRVVNNSKKDIDAIFAKYYGQKWLDYRKNGQMHLNRF